jgi:hypothetical protein
MEKKKRWGRGCGRKKISAAQEGREAKKGTEGGKGTRKVEGTIQVETIKKSERKFNRQ